MKKVVITGGPHSGKTTLLEMLRDEGFPIVEEAAIKVINDFIIKFGSIEESTAWRTTNVAEFQMQVLEKVLKLEFDAESSAGDATYMFYDRGVVDGIAYCNFKQIEVPAKLTQVANNMRYDTIFVLDTLSRFDNRTETGRTSKYEDSKKLRDLIYNAYTVNGYSPHLVKEMPIEDRIKFIKTQI